MAQPEWVEVLENLKRDLPRASFIAIKLVATGSPVRTNPTTAWYNVLGRSLSVHRPVQLGLCLFFKVASFRPSAAIDGGAMDDNDNDERYVRWEAHPYTLSLFCSHGYLAPSTVHFVWEKRNLINLISRGWNMDEWVDKGIPYLGKQEQEAVHKEKAALSVRAKARLIAFEPPKNNFRTTAFLESLRSTIDDWLLCRIPGSFVVRDEFVNCYGEDENTLIIIAGNGYFSFLAFWLVEREFGQVVIEWEKKKMRLKKLQGSKWVPPSVTTISQGGNKTVFSGEHYDLHYLESMKNYEQTRSLVELLFQSRKGIIGFDMLPDLLQIHASFLGSCSSFQQESQHEERIHMTTNYFIENSVNLVDMNTYLSDDQDEWDLYDSMVPVSPQIRLAGNFRRFRQRPETFEAGYLALLIGQHYVEQVLDTQTGFTNQNSSTVGDALITCRDLKLKFSLNEICSTLQVPSPTKAASVSSSSSGAPAKRNRRDEEEEDRREVEDSGEQVRKRQRVREE
eukprot:TRINITY_DN15156_c0_g1_i1.p1 TRINITY_DN15156_c0_g1~~TRINITY_DN15156_c0_g1_i1.p1  ORF type:complete len:520 (+),score=137.72 TRINITY_DN15156_c0_g1_i1:37-1560(+)